jgi:hypothetical protein
MRDALVAVLTRGDPLPEWLGLAVLDAVTWWVTHAPVKGRGRHTRWPRQRADELRSFAYAETFEGARSIGLTRKDAFAYAAEWHHVSADTIRESCRRAYRLLRAQPSAAYFSRACLDFMDRTFVDRTVDGSVERWSVLLAKYEGRRRAPDFRDYSQQRL